MADDVETFEDLHFDLVLQMGDLGRKIHSEQSRITYLLNDAASSPIAIAESGLPGGGAVFQAVKKWNNEILPSTDSAWQTLTDDLWDAVGELAGRPLALVDYSRAFSTVDPTIYDQEQLAQMMVIFKRDWHGQAAENYKVVAEQQEAAILALATACKNGAKMLAGVAKQILDLWRELSKEFLSWTADLIEVFASMTEVDNILSFEVPAILRAVKMILQNIIDLVDILEKYVISQMTDSINWRQLAGGAPGLPLNRWPAVMEANSDVINDPGQWAPQST